nr:very short patch repair endonuclease [Mycolicibacterium sp. GF69]
MRSPTASSAAVRASMQANRSRDTRPELALRRVLHSRGLRYYVARRPIRTLRRTADIVFPRSKVAVFVDGCFWHGCPEHHTVARANAEYWAEKVERNRSRDHETTELLRLAGWTVIRVWEHESVQEAADLIASTVGRFGESVEPRTHISEPRDSPHTPG